MNTFYVILVLMLNYFVNGLHEQNNDQMDISVKLNSPNSEHYKYKNILEAIFKDKTFNFSYESDGYKCILHHADFVILNEKEEYEDIFQNNNENILKEISEEIKSLFLNSLAFKSKDKEKLFLNLKANYMQILEDYSIKFLKSFFRKNSDSTGNLLNENEEKKLDEQDNYTEEIKEEELSLRHDTDENDEETSDLSEITNPHNNGSNKDGVNIYLKNYSYSFEGRGSYNKNYEKGQNEISNYENNVTGNTLSNKEEILNFILNSSYVNLYGSCFELSEQKNNFVILFEMKIDKYTTYVDVTGPRKNQRGFIRNGYKYVKGKKNIKKSLKELNLLAQPAFQFLFDFLFF